MKLLLPFALSALLVSCDSTVPPPPPPVPTDLPEIVQEDVTVIKFGLYASGKPTDLIKEFSPVLRELEDYVSTQLGTRVKISLVLSKTYDAGVDVIVKGTVDFARFGPASYVEAYARDNQIDVLALEAVNDDKVFHGVIVVKENSPIQTVEGLRGTTFAFGDDASTIGRFLSQQFLANNDIYAKDLDSFEYLGRHDKVGEAVGRGEFVAGALNEKTFKQLVDKGVPIRELARFENVTKPWIASSQLDNGLENLLREGLLQITNRSVTNRLKITGFLEGGDEDYVSIRESILNNSRFFEGYTNPE